MDDIKEQYRQMRGGAETVGGGPELMIKPGLVLDLFFLPTRQIQKKYKLHWESNRTKIETWKYINIR
jgi:hypothetical protein